MKKFLYKFIPVWIILGVFAYFYIFFNVFYNYTRVSDSSISVSRTEFPFVARKFHSVKFNGERSLEIVSKYSFMGTRVFYSDGLGKDSGYPDGLVDKISKGKVLNGNQSGTTLLREEDYLTHKKEFDSADKYLADTKEKFKGKLEKYNL
jgi:hypothetical protein